MKVAKVRLLLIALSAAILVPTMSFALGWGQINRDMHYANLWDQFTNRHYGGYNNALTWPGGWYDAGDNLDRRTYANYKGFVIGAMNIKDPQYPDVTWPYMVGQRDGRNDGEQGADSLAAPPTPEVASLEAQILFKGRLDRRTYRQALCAVTVNGVASAYHNHIVETKQTVELPGDEDDGAYQSDVIDPNIPCDLQLETYSWSRMGVSTNRMVYSFVDRNNDDAYFWHWRMINDGIWGRLGVARVDATAGRDHTTVEGVMMSLMFQWDRSSRGANATASGGEGNNDSIWNYYGVDYDGAQTEDMRLVWVRDGDQDPSKYSPDHGKQDDYGDPHPTTGELLTAKDAGLLFLHIDTSPTDRRDNVAQPLTIGWENYSNLLQTGTDGHESKYKQMTTGLQKGDEYYWGDYQTTDGRGTHPEAGQGASWIMASNDPAVSDAYWPGKILGIDPEVTDCEQQCGIGPVDLAPYDTVNNIFVLAVNGLDYQTAQSVGAQWLAGTIDDAAKNVYVFSAKDSLFNTMRQAKDVYESAEFPDGAGGMRYASTRDELEVAFGAAMTAGKLTLSPPAPATFDVQQASGRNILSWSYNYTTGEGIDKVRLYRALANYKGDSAWTKIAELDPNTTVYVDTDVTAGFSYYYYITTYVGVGNRESTMHSRTAEPAVPQPGDGTDVGGNRALRFALHQNAPNPFNPVTTIKFVIAEAGPVQLDVYSPTGQLVKTLVNESMPVGVHEIAWNGTDAVGRPVASGVYIYRIVNGENISARRMVLVR